MYNLKAAKTAAFLNGERFNGCQGFSLDTHMANPVKSRFVSLKNSTGIKFIPVEFYKNLENHRRLRIPSIQKFRMRLPCVLPIHFFASSIIHVGVGRSSVVPSPSRPFKLAPHVHKLPSAVIAIV